MPNDYFQFKEFVVFHDKCAMKVGTDAVLIGAWTKVDNADRVLDIGTGTGIIALMLAQRCKAKIEAVDIDGQAVEQARENVAGSPWSDRIAVVQADIKSMAGDVTLNQAYDCIVSNPPYFQEKVKCPELQRNTARHTDTLTFEELLQAVSVLLKEKGRFAVVLPAEVSTDFITQAIRHGLGLVRQTWVHTKEGKAAKRVLMEFGRGNMGIAEVSHLNLVNPDGSKNEEYLMLVKDFYLWS